MACYRIYGGHSRYEQGLCQLLYYLTEKPSKVEVKNKTSHYLKDDVKFDAKEIQPTRKLISENVTTVFDLRNLAIFSN